MLNSVQAALYQTLQVALAPIQVFDYVPQNTPPPYLAFGDSTTTPEDTLDAMGDQETVNLHLWSNYAGYAEIQAMMRTVYDALHNAVLDISDPQRDFVSCRLEFQQLFPDVDQVTQHAIMRVRILTFDKRRTTV